MHKLFVKTRNVKNFIGLMNNLIDKSNEVPKMGLVYGDPGLGKKLKLPYGGQQEMMRFMSEPKTKWPADG